MDYSFFIKCISDNKRHMLHFVSAALQQSPPHNYGVWVLHKYTAGIDMQETKYTEGYTESWLK